MRIVLIALTCLAMFAPVVTAGAQTRKVTAGAQTRQAPAGLTADRITYTTGYQTLQASGNVVIAYNGMVLKASALTYDAQSGRLTATGPLRLGNGDNILVIADFADLSTDFRDGVLKGARMVLNQQLQLSAVEIRRSQGRYSELLKAAASTCIVSLARPTPLWQLRAKRIIHDQQKRMLYFENARLQFLNLPVIYIPRLKVPDPSVKRANGFLVPALANSSLYGLYVTTPYFLTFGDYADVTLIPTIYSSGTATLQFKARKRFRNGRLDVQGAYTRDTVSTLKNRGYLFATGKLNFPNGFNGSMNLQMVSDNAYFLNHGLSQKDRLESFVRLEKTRRSSYFSGDIQGFRSLRSATASDQTPWLLTGAQYQYRFQPGWPGGQASVTLGSNGAYRRSMSDIVGRDVNRLAVTLDWQRDWRLADGLVFAAQTRLNAQHYTINQDSRYSGGVSRFVPIGAASMRWPLSKSNARATQIIEPMVQLVWSPNSITAAPNDDSALVDFGASNLFTLNRFSGVDRFEAGLRANIGVNYSRRSRDGWNIDATFGRVIRARDLGQFTAASGLSGRMSSYVLAARLGLPRKLSLVQRAVFDAKFNVSRNETTLIYKAKSYDIDTSFLWLKAGAVANVVDRSEWGMAAGFDLGNNWRTKSTWRYDLITAGTSNAGLSLTYRNECIKVDLSLSRRFVSSANIAASTNFGVQITLEGFGSRAVKTAGSKTCSEL